MSFPLVRLNRPTLLMAGLVIALSAGCAADTAEETDTVATPDPEAIRPFTIEVADDVLTDLQDRLARARLPEQIPGTGWDQGTNKAYLEELLAYWQDGFDWRAQEHRLNEFDHFKTDVDGIDVHFIHQRSANENAVPLLLVHGWPGSFVEFADLIGPLTDPEAHGGDAADAFHVVIPSLPGYGFSGKPDETGYNPERMADVLAGLMEKLGYDRYGAQGGDWGAIINRSLAGNYSDRLIGLHTNFMISGPAGGASSADVPAEEMELRRERAAAFADGRGYQAIQGTKPQTLGYGLNDSPTGLAAWIVEKFHGWSDNDGNVESAFTKDELLTNITLYWVTQTITSSTRLYYESGNTPATRPVGYIDVPTGVAVFPKEILFTPRSWAEGGFNIVRWTMMPRGGHFAALEEPELLVDDVRAFFRDLR
ncbi:MAG: epoxide hydrolase [Gemmatimonadetes bacterium]|jgi:microsomal epoxide hydrolase|nr:epoxide hydrolase [Gemmatimonadota bacterium]